LEEVAGPKARASRDPGTVRDHRPRGGHVSGLQADPAMARWVRAPVAEHVPRGVLATGPLYQNQTKLSAPAARRGVAALETRIRPPRGCGMAAKPARPTRGWLDSSMANARRSACQSARGTHHEANADQCHAG